MAASTNVQVIVDAQDNATSTLNNVGKGIQDVGEKAGVTTGQLIAGTAALGGLLAVGTRFIGSMVDTASQMEQNRIAFQTMLGSADLAKKTLSDLSDFAMKTPFNLPQVVEASQRLLAYNVEAKDLIPTLTTLGNISAGVGREKLPQLILAFGQVKAATKLTGMELRQFSEAGVPLLQALVDQANETGGVLTKMGKASKVTGDDVKEMGDKLSIAKQRLSEVSGNAKASKSSLMGAQNAVENLQQKMAGANAELAKGGEHMVRVKATAESMKDAISDGTVSFEQVQKALQKLSDTKFAGLMIEQSKSLGGIISNLQDVWSRFSMEVIGVQTNGDIRQGSIFTMLKQGALGLLDALTRIQGPVTAFIDKIVQNQVVFSAILGVIGALVLAVGVGLVAAFIALIAPIAGIITGMLAIGAAVGGGIGLLATMGVRVEDIGAIFNIAKTKVTEFVNEVLNLGPVLKGYLDKLIGDFKAFGERVYDTFKLDTSKIGIIDFFVQMGAKLTPVLNNITAQIKQGFTNALNINFGNGGNFGDLLGRILAVAQPVADVFLRALTPAINSLVEGFKAAQPMIDRFLQQIGPLLINGLQVAAGFIAAVAVAIMAIASGLITAFSTALPFIVQVFTGIAEFINGILAIIVGLFTLNFGMVLEGIKTLFQGIWDTITGVLGGIIMFVLGFVKGVIDFFKQLYDTLVGHSIIPDLVNAIVDLFTNMGQKVLDLASGLLSGLIEAFDSIKKTITDAITAGLQFIKDQLSNFKDWGYNIGRAFVDGLGDALNGIKDKVTGALNRAKDLLQGKSPPKEGPFKEIDTWGFNVGNAWVDSFSNALGTLPNQIAGFNQPLMQGAMALQNPTGTQQQQGIASVNEGYPPQGTVQFNVTIGLYAGTETEKRNIARELYQAVLQVAKSQNKTVAQFMGG